MKNFLKKIYLFIPFKKNLYQLIRKFYIPPKGVFKYLRFSEAFTINLSNEKNFKILNSDFSKGSFIENEIFWEGIENCWEATSIKIWSKFVEKSFIIFDIGANTGIYSLIAATINKNSKVFAFEPNDAYFPILENNILLNNYQKIVFPVKKAVGKKNGLIEIDNFAEHGGKIKEKCVKLDDFVMKHNLPSIDLLKIDVEHMESDVLLGMKKTLNNFLPSIILEVLTDADAEKLNYVLSDLNYEYFNINENGSIKKTDKIVNFNITVNSERTNYLICTKEKSNFFKKFF